MTRTPPPGYSGYPQCGGIVPAATLCLVRCLLVDDNGAFVDTARLLLAREGVVVAGTASSTAEALRQVSALRPDVVLVDIAADYADMVADSPAAGFLSKDELSAAAIQRILDPR